MVASHRTCQTTLHINRQTERGKLKKINRQSDRGKLKKKKPLKNVSCWQSERNLIFSFAKQLTSCCWSWWKKQNKKKREKKDNKFLRKQTSNAGQSFCVEVVRKLFTDKPLNTLSGKKLKKKRERQRCLKLSEVRGGFWQSSPEKWEGQRNYSLKDSLHKDANSCSSIRKDQRIEVRANSFALHSPFAPNFFVTWVSCEHGLWASLYLFLSLKRVLHFPCQKFAPFSPFWRWVHTFRCQKRCTLPNSSHPSFCFCQMVW